MKYPIVMYQTKLATGLSPSQYRELLDKLSSDVGIETIEAHNNVTSAYGFMYTQSIEEAGLSEEDVEKFASEIIADLDKENKDNVYEIRDGVKIYLGYPKQDFTGFNTIQ